MKRLLKTLWILSILPLIGFSAGNDVQLTQRKADDSGFVSRTLTPVVNGVWWFDGSYLPVSKSVADTKTALGLNSVENTALSTWGGSTYLITLGTVTTGTWHGTAIGDTYISSAAAWTGKQVAYVNLTTVGALANGVGWLHNDGAGAFAYSTPTAANVGAIPTALTSAYLLVGNASNVATGVAVTGDVTISNAGAMAIGANKVTAAMMATIPNNTIYGNISGGAAVPSALTLANVLAMSTTTTPQFLRMGLGMAPDSTRALVANGNIRASDQTAQVATNTFIGTSGLERIMFHAENATAWTPTVNTDATLSGFYSAPRIAATATTFSSNLYGFELYPLIVSSDVGARLNVTGISSSALRYSAADQSSYSGNGFTAFITLVGHYLGVPSTVVTGTAQALYSRVYNLSGTITTAYGLNALCAVGNASGPANPVIGTYYAIRLNPIIFANGGSITTEWGISQESTTAKNQFLGKTGIGAAPTTTSSLHLGGVPASAAGLATGDVWSNSGVLTLVL